MWSDGCRRGRGLKVGRESKGVMWEGSEWREEGAKGMKEGMADGAEGESR